MMPWDPSLAVVRDTMGTSKCALYNQVPMLWVIVGESFATRLFVDIPVGCILGMKTHPST